MRTSSGLQVEGRRHVPEIVGLSFNEGGKIYFFDPQGEQYAEGEAVLAETARGLELGWVTSANAEVDESTIVAPLKPIVRKAAEGDLKKKEELQRKAREALKTCEQHISHHKLPMKLIEAEYTFDGKRIIFHFASEGRVDFRELVKDLAREFKKRIELHQVGVRDEAKLYGGLGVCGRELCCSRFLPDFCPVAIKMAKAQELSLNPAKISGMCGRLMCCLRYEYELYEEGQKRLPKYGVVIDTPFGEGRVIGRDLPSLTVTVDVVEKGKQRMTIAQLEGLPCEECEATEAMCSKCPRRTDRPGEPSEPQEEPRPTEAPPVGEFDQPAPRSQGDDREAPSKPEGPEVSQGRTRRPRPRPEQGKPGGQGQPRSGQQDRPAGRPRPESPPSAKPGAPQSRGSGEGQNKPPSEGDARRQSGRRRGGRGRKPGGGGGGQSGGAPGQSPD